MHPSRQFHHCPRCGNPITPPKDRAPMVCAACNFQMYFNPAVAVAVFIQRDDGNILLIRRANDPGAGLLAPPGGFIDIGECAESAVHREILEEVGIRLSELRFLCSQPNEYLFSGVTYPVLDLFFTAQPLETEGAFNPEEVHAVEWHPAKTLQGEALAFQSMRAAWQVWLEADAKISKAPVLLSASSASISSDRLTG
ncbi:MAG: NUDIX domain-containing protein [Verrucomicrobia bacterium]|nr:NUDIX domain-containing protein [Verrucomicrobiota bacterium]